MNPKYKSKKQKFTSQIEHYKNINFQFKAFYNNNQIMLEEPVKNRVVVRSFNDIQIEPDTINFMFFAEEEHNLYVSREKSTEVYHVVSKNQELDFHHIARLPWSKYAVRVNSITFLFCPFELRVCYNNSWDVHPFTTELLSINVKKVSPSLTLIYSFHEQQTIEYRLSSNQDDDDFTINFVSKGKQPFHVTKENIVEGYGKKIGNVHKNTAFTVCDFKIDDYVVVGDTEGGLHIYDYRTLGHLKSFKKHLGPILAIKIDQENNTVFFTGSDSKVVAIKRVNEDWTLTGEVRGQSHDIFALEIVNDTLVSGGLTTDFCCYPIHNSKQVLQSFQNKVSFYSQTVVHSMKNYLLINKLTSFELWKIMQTQGELEYLVSYQMPAQKFIKDIKISKKLNDKTHLIIVSSEIDTVGWKFDQENGLVKLFTIKNSYEFIQFLPGKNVFIGLRDSGEVEKVFCKTGKIDEIVSSEVFLPTDMKLLQNEKLVVASNLSHQVRVFDLKKKVLLSKHTLKEIYQVVCEKSEHEFILKYVGDKKLYSCDFSKKVVEQSEIMELPEGSNSIRYGGVIIHQSQVTKNLKRYWFFASENKIYLVNNLNSEKKKKSVRSIFTRRIGTVIKPKVNKAFELGVVHLNFRRMISNMEVKPLIAKKIV